MTKSADIRQLQIGFQQSIRPLVAVDGISFSLRPGETLALLGESGCGKSLTSLALMRLLPEGAVYGMRSQVRVDDEDILDLPENLMRQLRGRRIAIIFQEPMTALNPVMRIGDQLAEAFRDKAMSPSERHQRLLRLLEEVEIPEPELRLTQYPHQLSGGQKQRIVIAMALANNPDILIADEPTTALDVTIQAQILALLKKLQQEHQMSLLLITHDLGVVKAVADRVCVMYAGQVVEEARVSDFFKQVRHPYSQQLLASIPGFSQRNYRLQTISGTVPAPGAMPSGCRFHPRCAHVMSRCRDDEPVLQTIEEESVRCHLYPRHRVLPTLNQEELPWPQQTEQGDCLFSVTDLCVQFGLGGGFLKPRRAAFKAVDKLSFRLHKGRTLALVGESGCGKTTVSRALLRLLPISSGILSYRDEDVLAMSRRQLRSYRKQVQLIFQDPFAAMNPRMMVGDIIAEGLLAQGMRAADIKRRQLVLLDQVNLPASSLTRYPHQFSGGQRQRICIARALATEPEVLICDEPTSALDMSVQAQILNLLKELQGELGMSYLFITHNMSVVSWLADEILVMRQGQVVESGPCEQILKNPTHAYTRRLLDSVLQI
ncbi:ABC transporter ATP-binding protein [Legionella sp. CNM-4043-24]|uniref:ABC transporter ATP-binding protein n=1 Tax=Legionella sp. CNM-4043-24 TaxID=3421646 RepID=UPI00403AE713